jgi:protein-S-isoprenylcysteine O-methyltransferase Ste14
MKKIRALRLILFLAIFMLIGGNYKWIQGWIFVVFMITQIAFSTTYLKNNRPDLFKERTSKLSEENQKKWDKILLGIYLISITLWMFLMPLDSQRLHLTKPFGIFINSLGLCFMLTSFTIVFLSLLQNNFASHTVRIQDDRGQKVVTNGLYSFVRHPLYFGSVFWHFGVPMLLSSYLGLIGGIFLTLIFVVRIIGEEKMLTAELEGYADYKKKVKYRLIPLIW